jgi:serine phosphatase RsbU (regulator of sigma subunit)
MIFLSILLTVFNVNIKEPMVFFGLLVYAIMAMYLSTQMRWVAFLSKRQKIQTIFYFFLFTIIVSLILQNFFFESYTFGENAHAHLLVIDCAHKFFLLSTFTFVLFYTISSLLILLFHLPTSGVFEEKLNINNSFKDLSQNLSKYKKHDDIYQILLDTVLSSSTSKYGWIKHVDETEARFAKNISAEDLQSIYSFINQTKRKKNQFSQTHVQKIHKQNNLPFFSEKKIHSMLITPIFIENVQVAEIGVLKKLSNGFDIEMMEIISSYVSQASVSVENIELLNKALENERYKEEIKIAKKVKQKLINQHLTISENIQTAFYSVSSDSVGGDFFDVHSFSEKLHLFVIGDVAGNGTAAAFNLAQLKGIFKSLVQNIVDFEQYPKVFNQALYECFEKNSFVSLSFFLINEENQTIKHFRCGHVPAIHINENSTKVLNPRGIGLGMVENEQMLPLTQMQIFDYQSEDILFCYTDGLIETVSKEKKKFEIEELTHIISNNYNQNATFVVEKVKQTFHEFLGKEDINTDVSFVCIKFK